MSQRPWDHPHGCRCHRCQRARREPSRWRPVPTWRQLNPAWWLLAALTVGVLAGGLAGIFAAAGVLALAGWVYR